MKPTADQFHALALDEIDTLYRTAKRLTRDATRAEDLVQETYARALAARASFDLQAFGIRPWLLRIMHNLHYTRAGRERRQPTSIDGETLTALATDDGASASRPLGLDLERLDGPVARALHELPEDYQAVLLLWAVEELSYKEIAMAVDVPIGTVMSRLHRARQKLSERLGAYARKEGILRE